MHDRHERVERGIFNRFLATGALMIREASVEKRHPPEPDLFCIIEGSGAAAFELVEIVDNELAEMANNQVRLDGVLHDAAAHMGQRVASDLGRTLGDALILVRFAQVSLRERESAISPLLRFLAELPPGTAGELQIGRQGGMASVESIRITRGNYPPGPHFQVEAVRSIADPIVERLQNKYTKRYETRHPTHLLAYYDLHPASPPDIWLSDARNFIRSNWATAPFARVWIMDATEPRILLDLSPETTPENAA
jgi:hypothetical protein